MSLQNLIIQRDAHALNETSKQNLAFDIPLPWILRNAYVELRGHPHCAIAFSPRGRCCTGHRCHVPTIWAADKILHESGFPWKDQEIEAFRCFYFSHVGGFRAGICWQDPPLPSHRLRIHHFSSHSWTRILSRLIGGGTACVATAYVIVLRLGGKLDGGVVSRGPL
jgi:hypothetical protein